MTRVLLSGCNGRMGQTISRLAAMEDDIEIVAGYDINDSIKNTYPVYTDLFRCNEDIDVIIDFSNPAGLGKLLDYAVSRKIAVVIATTGFSDEQKALMEDASKQIPVFTSANMSLGVNLLIDLVKKATKLLYKNFDIEIIEKHHNQKLDAPSGTALAIADSINSVLDSQYEYSYDRHTKREKRKKSEIGIHAVRGGTIVGEHTVIFAGNDEIIEITHKAMSRDIFGVGALRAARFVHNKKPGLYHMNNLIENE